MPGALRFATRTADLYMKRRIGRNLFEPVSSDGGERGSNWEGHTRESSVYTKAMLHPAAAAGILASVVGFGMWRLGRGTSRH